MRIVAWNVQRKRPTTPTGAAAVARVAAEDADVVVLTEARTGHLASLGGYEIDGGPTPSRRFADDERKVLAWSKNPWRDIDDVGHPDMPPARFVAATTDTPLGDVRVIAVCIPWHMCDVTSGAKDRKPWEQHLRWLHLFGPLISGESELPTVIAGDFNQRIPRRKGGRRDVADVLATTLQDFAIVTSGTPPGCTRQGIDHIAIDARLVPAQVRGWPHDDAGVRMSDHDAAMVDLVLG